MYEQIRGDILFFVFYGIVTAMAMMAGCYLLLRKANAIAPDVTPPVRLRRWTAAFFAAFVLNHVWYLPIGLLSSPEDIKMVDLVGGMLDSLTVFPLMIIILLTMLQDRRRPLWPVGAIMVPFFLGSALNVATRSYDFLPPVYIYSLLMCIGLIIYMVRATRQYGRWLRDNYADLEHKEVWQSFVVLAIILLMIAVYAFTSQGLVYLYAMHVVSAVLICYLLWRVETLSDLSMPQLQSIPEDMNLVDNQESDTGQKSLSRDIGPLLQKYCIDSQLYLQHDLTIHQLAKAVGTNRLYLSQYFSAQGINYNAYINDLRIDHFMGLYREAVTARRSVTAQQLAQESGFRNYNTFRNAFKRKTGQLVTVWMKTASERKQSQTRLLSAEREQSQTHEG